MSSNAWQRDPPESGRSAKREARAAELEMTKSQRPNPRLQRTPSAAPPSPLSRQPLGDT